MGYVFSDGEIVEAKDNEAKTAGAVARFYMKTKTGMPTLEGKSKLYVDILKNGDSLKEALEILEKLNANEARAVACGLEKLLDRSKASIHGDNVEFSANIPEGEYYHYLNKDGKKTGCIGDWVARYLCMDERVFIEINPELDKSYDFSMISSCIYGLKHANINRLKKVASELKKYSPS